MGWPKVVAALGAFGVVMTAVGRRGLCAAVLCRQGEGMGGSALCWQRTTAALDMLCVVASAVARRNVEAAVLNNGTET